MPLILSRAQRARVEGRSKVQALFFQRHSDIRRQRFPPPLARPEDMQTILTRISLRSHSQASMFERFAPPSSSRMSPRLLRGP